MSTRLKEKIEKIEELIERLAIQSARDVPIVVEGQNDVNVLRKLALNGVIIAAKTRIKTHTQNWCVATYLSCSLVSALLP